MKNLSYRIGNAVFATVYRASGGKVGGRMGKAPVLLLTTTGRRSGKRRTAPLLYLRDGDALAIVASKGGDPRHPGWFLNLRERPDVEVEVGGTRERRRARVATEAERARLWPQLVEIFPRYGDYQRRVARSIPVVLLEKE